MWLYMVIWERSGATTQAPGHTAARYAAPTAGATTRAPERAQQRDPRTRRRTF